jgi:hypothetical protein
VSDDWLTTALAARRAARPQPTPAQFPATHRADPTDPALPPLYACREADLTEALERGRPGVPHTLSAYSSRTGWRAWRAWP